MITKVIKVSNQVGYGLTQAFSSFVYNEHDLKGNKVDQYDQDDAKYVDQIASVEIDILAEFTDVDGASSEGHGLVRFVDFDGEAVIIPYVYHGVYKDKLTTPEQVLIFDAIRDAGIKLSDELNYAADTVEKRMAAADNDYGDVFPWFQYRQPAEKTYVEGI